MGFCEAISTPEQIRKAVEVLAPMPVSPQSTQSQSSAKWPYAQLMINLVPNSKCPPYTIDEVASFGVKLAIYSAISANAAMHAMRKAIQALKDTGRDDAQGEKWAPKDFFELMRLDKEVALDEAAGGRAFAQQ